LDALDEHPAIPTAIVDRQRAAAGQVTPEAPQVVLRLLLVRRRRNRNHAVVARVERAGHATNRPAFAGGVPTLEDGDGGAAVALELAEVAVEPALQRLEALVVLL